MHDSDPEAMASEPNGPAVVYETATSRARRRDARAANRLHTVTDARLAARRRLPGVVFDYIDGGADEEVTMRANETAFGAHAFRPRAASGRFSPSLTTKVLGRTLELPVILAPCGLVRVFHPDGPAGAARAAASTGTISVLSSVAGLPLADVAREAGVPLWFQLYASEGRSQADALSDAATEATVDVLFVTVDTPALGNRIRDIQHGVVPPLRIDAHNAVQLGRQVLRKPRWALRMATTGLRLTKSHVDAVAKTPNGIQMAASPFSWPDIAHIRKRWHGQLVIKGILSGEDARRAVDVGADAVVVSNHGGRQLDGAPAALSVLPEVAAAVATTIGVLLDGGVRRGSHVVTALALGARAVLIGRPYLYALAVGGEVGVMRLLDILRTEIERTLLLLGCRSVSDLGSDWLYTPTGENA